MYKYIKRMFDFILSSIMFIIICPIFIVLMVLVRINLGRPIFFRQKRSGYKEKEFNMIKFRTMTEEKDENGRLLSDDKRSTKFGKFLRTSSLDELPELLCIIKGDMSIIGPRPLPVSYNDYLSEEEKIRFNVRGGLIPPDSIDKEPIISWDKQFKYEIEYANNCNIKKDIHIFFNVFKIIFLRKKINYGSFVRKPLNEERKKEKEKAYD